MRDAKVTIPIIIWEKDDRVCTTDGTATVVFDPLDELCGYGPIEVTASQMRINVQVKLDEDTCQCEAGVVVIFPRDMLLPLKD